jgi:hypothetical protein
MTSSRNACVIRDVVHDYIPVSSLERQIIGHPLMLRLQHVSQNGLAYQTYPGCRTSRFAHSLGCMHIGSRLFLAARASTPTSTWNKFRDACKTVSAAPYSHGCKDAKEHEDPLYLTNGLANGGDRVIFQSLRIACLLHDVGHAPFSHTLEGILHREVAQSKESKPGERRHEFASVSRTLLRGKSAIHEAFGELLMKAISADQGQSVFVITCCMMARDILGAKRLEPRAKNPLFALREIVTSDLDADRLDYVLRDGAAAGIEFGRYDLTRIVQSYRLATLPTESERWVFRPSTKALSAVEMFFVQRYLLWKWLMFHHSVVRSDVAMSQALHGLFEVYFDRDSVSTVRDAIRKILEDRQFDRLWKPFQPAANLVRPDDVPMDGVPVELEEDVDDSDPEDQVVASLRSYRTCTEAWLLDLLYEVHDVFDTEKSTESFRSLSSGLQIVLERNARALCPLWKHLEDYQSFAEAALVAAADSKDPILVEVLKRAGYSNFRAAVDAAITPAGKPQRLLNELLGRTLRVRLEGGFDHDSLLRSFGKRLGEHLGTAISGSLVVWYTHKFYGLAVEDPESPIAQESERKEPDETVPYYALRDEQGARWPRLTTLSTLVAQLGNASLEDVHLRVFVIPSGKNSDTMDGSSNRRMVDASKARAALAKVFIPTLSEFWDQLI